MDASFRTYYMDEAVFNLAQVVEEAQAELEDVEFDALVGTGFSGSIVIPALALTLGKKFVLIRKETDDSHHGRGRMVGQLGERWIFVDDFISSGATRRRVMQKVADALRDGDFLIEKPITMVGQYMYQARAMGNPGFTPFCPDWTPRDMQRVRGSSECNCPLCQSNYR